MEKQTQRLLQYLETSYTAYQAVENAEKFLTEKGFKRLSEGERWSLSEGGKYYVTRGGSALIAFTVGKGNAYKIVASHTDSPCLKLKENPVTATEKFKKLNVEPYGGGIWYSFFDRPLRLAGRVIRENEGKLISENYVSDFTLLIPSVAVHMQRDVNDKFAPNPQVDLLPLLGMNELDFNAILGNPLSYDLYVVSAEKPFSSGMNKEFISAPRIDNLSSVFSSLESLAADTYSEGVCVAACLDSEEVGSHTRSGAAGDFLKAVLRRIAEARGLNETDFYRAASTSFLISLDNAHSVHPNHPEKCDPTNRAVMGGGIVLKGHAGGAYTTDAFSSAVVKKIFKEAGVKYQCFYNRSDMRSGGTLGAISLGQISIPSADLGLAQLAMHSAVESFCGNDYEELLKGLNAFYSSEIIINDSVISVKNNKE